MDERLKPLPPADNETVLDEHLLEGLKKAPNRPRPPPYRPRIDTPPLAPS